MSLRRLFIPFLPKGQGWFISRMQKVGYSGDDEGVCFGVAYKSMLDFLSGNFASFIKQLELIYSIPKEQYDRDFNKIKEKKVKIFTKVKLATLKQMGIEDPDVYASPYYDKFKNEFAKNLEIELNKKENYIYGHNINSLLEIPAFFEEVELLHKIFQYPHLFPKDAIPKTQDDALSALEILRPEAKKNYATMITSFPGCYDQNDLNVYIQTLLKQLETADFPISFILSSGDHTIHLGYDHKDKLLIDANFLPVKYLRDNEMSKTLINSLSENETAIFETKIYVAKEHEEKAKKLISAWQQDKKWQEIHDPSSKNKHCIYDAFGHSYLYIAARSGCLEIVKSLIKNGANVNPFNEDYPNPFHIAVEYGYLDIVKTLLVSGANVNAADELGVTALFIAAQNGHLEILKTLINHGAEVNAPSESGATALFIAAQHGHHDIVKTLLAIPVDVNASKKNGTTPLYIATQHGHHDIVKELIANGAHINAATSDYITPLHVAARNGNLQIVKTLIDSGAQINVSNKTKRTPLHLAAEKGHFNIVQFLLAKGADVNKPNELGNTPLYIAAENGHFDIVQALLAKGTDANKPNIIGITPLYVAASKGHLDIVRALLAGHADVNKPNKLGATPLYIAVQKGYLKVVAELLQKKSKLDTPITANCELLLNHARNKGCAQEFEKLLKQKNFNKMVPEVLPGFTPLHAAVFFGHTDIVLLLLKKGADIEQTAMGISVLDLARVMNQKAIVALIEAQSKKNKFNAHGYEPMEISRIQKRKLPSHDKSEMVQNKKLKRL